VCDAQFVSALSAPGVQTTRYVTFVQSSPGGATILDPVSQLASIPHFQQSGEATEQEKLENEAQHYAPARYLRASASSVHVPHTLSLSAAAVAAHTLGYLEAMVAAPPALMMRQINVSSEAGGEGRWVV
jgi:hypothetical protein